MRGPPVPCGRRRSGASSFALVVGRVIGRRAVVGRRRLVEQLGEALGIAGEEVRTRAGRFLRGRRGLAPAAALQPVGGLGVVAVRDRELAGEREAQRVRVDGLDRQLRDEQRPLVLAHGELHERQLVVPAQQLAIRLAERIVDRRGVMGPADEREGRVEDERDPERGAAGTVEDEIPGRDTFAIRALQGLETQLCEPGLDVGSGHRRRPGGGRHGGQSTRAARFRPSRRHDGSLRNRVGSAHRRPCSPWRALDGTATAVGAPGPIRRAWIAHGVRRSPGERYSALDPDPLR